MPNMMNMEHDRPVEWLHGLEHEGGAMGQLVQESGSLLIAAFRVARARCHTPQPTTAEVSSVAKELATRVGCFDVLPTRTSLAAECARHGLRVAA